MITVSNVLSTPWLRSDTKVRIVLYAPGELGCTVASGNLSQSQVHAYDNYLMDHIFYDAETNTMAIGVIGDLII